MTFTAYFDRQSHTVKGAFTLQSVEHGEVDVLFSRLPATSGQAGYTGGGLQDWVTGKSPIPMGRHWLSTKKEKLNISPVGTPFYPVGSSIGSRVIYGPGTKSRTDCGLHLENLFPGTAGCIALDVSTKLRETRAYQLFAILDFLYAGGVQAIPLVVL